jgi:hypothetical protein
MKIEFIEIIIVAAIVLLQLYVYIRTLKQIKVYRNIIPKTEKLKITKIFVPETDLEKLSPQKILNNISNYSKSKVSNLNIKIILPRLEEHIEINRIEINIIETENVNSSIFNKIINSVNIYLIRNRGAASDFNLMKDIVERNTNVIEDEINSSIGIPLYLGLMGTMIGIVIGLFNMPDLSLSFETTDIMDLKLNEGIGLLVGGVKIAMIASFFGLMLTIYISGWLYRGSKSYSEQHKNEFYTFIQIELLPLLNQGLASTFESLQRNLLNFNNEFSANLKGLKGIFDSSRQNIIEQKELINALDKAKVSEMTRYNVAVLKQLDVSVGQFEKFNIYLGNVNKMVENTNSIVNRTNDLLTRTDDIKRIANNLDDKLNQSQMLMQFLQDHFENLNQHKELTNMAVAEVGHTLSNTFKELKVQIQNSSDLVKKFTVDETELLKKALSESKTNLGNLEHLATLKNDVGLFKNSSASQGERLKQSIDSLNENMEKSIAILEYIKDNNSVSIWSLFKSKK